MRSLGALYEGCKKPVTFGALVLCVALLCEGIVYADVLEGETNSRSSGAYAVRGRATARNVRNYGGRFVTRSKKNRSSGVIGIAGRKRGQISGVWGKTKSTAGKGVYGLATATTGTTYGVYGRSKSANGRGVYGEATATTGETCGVYGKISSTINVSTTPAIGVAGNAIGTTGITHGVCGQNVSTTTSSTGAKGIHLATSGQTYGVHGENMSSSGRGVYGQAGATTGTNYGVYGETSSSNGYPGYFTGGMGVRIPVQTTGADPTTVPVAGTMILDNGGGNGKLYIYNGTSWRSITL